MKEEPLKRSVDYNCLVNGESTEHKDSVNKNILFEQNATSDFSSQLKI